MSIVCGIDFSRWSLAAMRFSAALAHRLNQELWLVHVVPLDAKESEKTQGTALAQGTNQLDGLRASLAHLPVRVKTQSVAGPPSDALLETAHRLGASLLVVGSAGHSDRPLGQLGGTSERIAAQGALPVVVVRDDESLARWTSGAPLRVLIGVDGSMSSAAAVRWVERLRAVAPVDVVLGQIYYADEAARHYGVSHSAPLEVADPQLESLLERDLRQRIPSLRGEGALVHRAKLGLGRIGDHLAELARDERCQMIVVGTHGKHGVARWWSVSAAALHVSRTAVAVIPSEPEVTSGGHQRLRHLLVSTDFSDCGNAALPWAYDMAAPGGTVTLVHVAPKGHAEPLPSTDRELEARLRALPGSAPTTARVATNAEVLHDDDPARAISRAAARLGVDAIVMSSHGTSGLKRAVLGSVTDEVLRASTHPVFVVRPTP